MKKIISLFLLCFGLLTAKAQVADFLISDMLNKSDWFALEREYPALKDSLQMPFLKFLAEAMIAVNFNRDDEAVSAIDTLIAKHQQYIGFDNTMNIVMIKAAVENRRGNSAKAAEQLNNFITQVKAHAPQIDLSAVETQYRYYKTLSATGRKMTLTRPEGDVVADIRLKRQSRKDNDTSYVGYSIIMPVKINGKSYNALLDTGCSGTMCQKSFAEKIGLESVSDSIAITGAGTVAASIGVIDSINIGSMTLHNALTTIVDNDSWATDSCQQYDFVIGLDFLKLCGETCFLPKEGKIIFPATLTPLPDSGHNIIFTADNNLRLEAYVNNERCRFFFDTGNSITSFSNQYYERHKEQIDKTAQKITREGGGIGYKGMLTTLKLPPVTMSTGGSNVRLDHVAVALADIAPAQIDDGNVGVNLIQNCRKATLNLKDLFLKIEN